MRDRLKDKNPEYEPSLPAGLPTALPSWRPSAPFTFDLLDKEQFKQIDLNRDLNSMMALGAKLLAGKSVNDTNRSLLRCISDEARDFSDTLSRTSGAVDEAAVNRWRELRSWFFFFSSKSKLLLALC